MSQPGLAQGPAFGSWGGESENGLGQAPWEGKLWSVAGEGQAHTPALDSAPNLCSSPLQLVHGAWLDVACPALAMGAGSSPLLASVSPLHDKAGSKEMVVRKGN